MRDLYASYATALRDALRHAIECGGKSSLERAPPGRAVRFHAHRQRCDRAREGNSGKPH